MMREFATTMRARQKNRAARLALPMKMASTETTRMARKQ
jgi:hypothetical protein